MATMVFLSKPPVVHKKASFYILSPRDQEKVYDAQSQSVFALIFDLLRHHEGMTKKKPRRMSGSVLRQHFMRSV
jgi:hypothetical protein